MAEGGIQEFENRWPKPESRIGGKIQGGLASTNETGMLIILKELKVPVLALSPILKAEFELPGCTRT